MSLTPRSFTKGDFSCCIDCKKREVGCHSTCEDYKAVKKEIATKKAIMRKVYNTERIFNEFEVG